MNETTTAVPDVILGKGGPSSHGWHSLVSYLECPKKFQYEKVRGLKIPYDQTPDALAVGSLFHAMRARLFSLRFANTAEAWDSLLAASREATLEQPAPISPEAERKALALIQAYREFYSTRPAVRPVAAEYLVEGRLAEEDHKSTWFSARLDDVSEYPGVGLCIGEGKTCSDINTCVTEYTQHGQPLLQAALWRASPLGEAMHGAIKGVMLDICQKGQVRKLKSGEIREQPAKFQRVFIPINDMVLDWYMADIRAYRAEANMVDWSSRTRRNVTACSKVYGRMRVQCPYLDLCRHGRNALGNYVLADGKTNAADWKPEYEGQTPIWK
jgi:hypothetical protein